MPVCCICGKELPNRYAVAGTCEDDGCGAVFCALHWNNGNRRCGSHGWKPAGLLAKNVDPKAETPIEPGNGCSGHPASGTMNEEKASESEIRDAAKKNLTKEQAAGIVRSTVAFASKLGHSAVALVSKIRNANSPETMLASIDESLAASREKRGPLLSRSEELYAEIASRKKLYQAAPPARKKFLEMELKAMLAEYKGLERQLSAFFENENTLNTVRGRVLELMALGTRKIDEKTIDVLTDKIEDAVGEAEDVAGAVRDLDKAGKRRENEADAASFEDALAGFDAEPGEPAAADSAADPFAVDPPPRAPEAPAPEEP